MKPIPTIKLVAEPIGPDARDLSLVFKWNKAHQPRHQIGGTPAHLKEVDWPKCPNGCGKMTFYGQLDSINDDICIADLGMIQVFLCFDCFETTSLVQSG
jgi:hypothetical protein